MSTISGWEEVTSRVSYSPCSTEVVVEDLPDSGILGVFCGEPFAYEVGPELRVLLNFYDYSTRTMRVLSFNTVSFKGVVCAREKYDLDRWCFTVKADSVLPESALSLKEKDKVYGLGLHDLLDFSSRSSAG